MKKQIFIPKNSTVYEQAEILAKMQAQQDGFKVGSSQYNNAVKQYLLDRYMHSSIPHIQNPSIPNYIHDVVFEPLMSFLNRNKSKMKKPPEYYANRIKAAVTNLTQVFLELEMGFVTKGKESSFNRQKGSKGDQVKETILRQYTRYMIMTSMYSILNGIFEAREWQIKELFKMQGIQNYSKDELAKKESIKNFVDSVQKTMNKVFDGKNIITKFVNVSSAKGTKKKVQKGEVS